MHLVGAASTFLPGNWIVGLFGKGARMQGLALLDETKGTAKLAIAGSVRHPQNAT